MPPTRRKQLENISRPDSSTHAGLWLDKYMGSDATDGKRQLVDEVAQIKVSPLYERFYDRWKRSLEELGAQCREARCPGRVAINLGAEGVLETAIALHHTYGVPYLPGSALKGLAAHYAANRLDKVHWGRGCSAFKILFGDPTSAGYVHFFDALYIPGSAREKGPLWEDVITVHHPKYYQGDNNSPPADWDSPIPIPFLTASGSFLIALSGPAQWVQAAFEILGSALRDEGIGAKTSSGYGRMELSDSAGNSARSSSMAIPAQKGSRTREALPPGYQRGVVKKSFVSYAFIQPERGGNEVFVHFSALAPGLKTLSPGQRVIFKPGPGKRPGQVQATEVRLEE